MCAVVDFIITFLNQPLCAECTIIYNGTGLLNIYSSKGFVLGVTTYKRQAKRRTIYLTFWKKKWAIDPPLLSTVSMHSIVFLCGFIFECQVTMVFSSVERLRLNLVSKMGYTHHSYQKEVFDYPIGYHPINWVLLPFFLGYFYTSCRILTTLGSRQLHSIIVLIKWCVTRFLFQKKKSIISISSFFFFFFFFSSYSISKIKIAEKIK
jgi:hypothetical protein